MRWGGVKRCLNKQPKLNLKRHEGTCSSRCAGPSWLVGSPAPPLLTWCVVHRSCLTLQPQSFVYDHQMGLEGSISDRFYPADQWFSKQCTQNNSINITRKLARRVNSWDPSHIHWIKNSGSRAQESVSSIPRPRDSDAQAQLWEPPV